MTDEEVKGMLMKQRYYNVIFFINIRNDISEMTLFCSHFFQIELLYNPKPIDAPDEGEKRKVLLFLVCNLID